MGERSKKLGEYGEDIVASLLTLIGWKSPLPGIDIDCFKPTQHGSAGSLRRTHGIDFLFSCSSPLEDQMLKHILISSKFKAGPYPSNPVAKFKEYFLDLSVALECFKRSDICRKINASYRDVSNQSISGVLFWLSGTDSVDASLVDKVAASRGLDEFGYGTIYVVDNYRASFLFDSIGYVNGRYGSENVSFLYPPTGKNIAAVSRMTRGRILPVEYLNSGMILFSATQHDQRYLVICCQDSFDEMGLRRLVGYSMSVALAYPSKVIIAFPDYDFIRHGEQVGTLKAALNDKDFAQSIEVVSYLKDFRGIEV